MRPPELRALFDGEIVVDSFAGGGGASQKGKHRAPSTLSSRSAPSSRAA